MQACDSANGDDAHTRPLAVTALVAAHNRRDSTVRSLSALAGQSTEADISVILVDDGSTDGTAAAARRAWPGLTILTGDGTLFWAKSMAVAEQEAWRGNFDFLLWLNDDVVLDVSALSRMLDIHRSSPGCIVVGAVRAPDSGKMVYGGRRRSGRHPQRLALVTPSEEVQAVDTFNGNVVLVPRAASSRIGPIDGLFPHAYADDDYGLRATAAGTLLLQCPGTVGTCAVNQQRSADGKSLVGRWRDLQSPKGLPWRAQVRFYRRHGGPEWPMYLAWNYFQRLRPVVAQPRRRRRRKV